MTALLLDAGAFVAYERDDLRLFARLRVAQTGHRPLRTPSIVVAQVWRGTGGRQARLARLLGAVDIVTIDADLARAAGTLLGRTGSSDAIDATLVVLAKDGDDILTSDARDIQALVDAAGKRVGVVAC